MTESDLEVDILPIDKYKPSTITMAGYFNTTVGVRKIVDFIPINHVFEGNKRIKVKPGSRKSIGYLGIEEVFISACYGNIKRGMRTGAMNNMASLDIQIGGKNIHLKLSSRSITSVGTRDLETGERVFGAMIDNINELQNMIRFLENVDKGNMQKYIEWFSKNTLSKKGLIRESRFLKRLDKNLKEEEDGGGREMRKVVKCFGKYINDFDSDQHSDLMEKINQLLEAGKIYGGDKLECRDVTIYNSVYYHTPFKKLKKDKDFSIALHQLAPFLASVGLTVEYHNWNSEGVNVCVDALEPKIGSCHGHKEYKHRFIIHETGRIRQCSPTRKEEAYRNYLGIMKLLDLFMKSGEIPYEKYIYDNKKKQNKKLDKMISKLLS